MEINNEKRRIPLYVLNNFIKFERKLYQFAGLPLGRAIRLKTVIYFLVTLLIGIAIYFTPVINVTIRWMQPAVLLMIPVGVAWVLSDLGTEDRSPMKFFRSYIKFNYKRITGGSFYRNKKISRVRTYSFDNYISYSSQDYATDIGMMKFDNVDVDVDKEKVIEDVLKDTPSNELVPITSSYDLTSHLFGNSSNVDDVKEAPVEDMTINDEVIDVTDKKQGEITDTEESLIEGEPSVDEALVKEEIVIVKKEETRKKTTPKKIKKKKSQPERKNVYIIMASVVIGSLAVFMLALLALDFMDSKDNLRNDNSIGADIENQSSDNQQEENLLKGIRQASMQNYEEAVKYFDDVDFDLLEQEDKEIVLLSYLFTDQIEKTLDLDPEFDEVVASYYIAKENLSVLRQYQDRSDEFKFVLAVEDGNYRMVVDLKDRVFIDEEREEVIVNAYIELDDLDEAIKFSKQKENHKLINQVEKIKQENKDNKKEKAKNE